MRDPKELVAKVDSSVSILIGILLFPLGLSITPANYRVLLVDGSADTDSCTVDSLEPLVFVAFLAITFIQVAVMLSMAVQAIYTTPSLKPPFKVKLLACAAWIFVSLAQMLSMILIVMSCEVKFKKLECFHKWMSMTVIIICISIIMGYLYIIYAWIVRAPDAPDAITVPSTDPPMAASVDGIAAQPTTSSITTPITAPDARPVPPPVASHTVSSIACPAAPDH